MTEIVCGIISLIIAILYLTVDRWSRWVWSPTRRERQVPHRLRNATRIALPENHRILRLPNVAPRAAPGPAAAVAGEDELPSGDEKA